MKRWMPFLAAAALAAALLMSEARRRGNDYDCYNGALVSGAQVNFLSVLSAGSEMEDVRMQVVYQLARRSVVKAEVKTLVGSGLVWKIDDDGIVLVSNRHLLMQDVSARVTFCNGESADAHILGYSQQYDIGFLTIDSENMPADILRTIYEAVPAEYDVSSGEYADRPVLQVGADLTGGSENVSTGRILGTGYEPVFNTDVLITECYSKAGMSGGGVFDVGGRLIGMLSGGEVAEDAAVREADITYSLPVALIAQEYRLLTDMEEE